MESSAPATTAPFDAPAEDPLVLSAPTPVPLSEAQEPRRTALEELEPKLQQSVVESSTQGRAPVDAEQPSVVSPTPAPQESATSPTQPSRPLDDDPLVGLRELKLHFEADRDNPTYSKNQRNLAERIPDLLDVESRPSISHLVSPVPHVSAEPLAATKRGGNEAEIVFGNVEDSEEDTLGEVVGVSAVLAERHRRASEPLPFRALQDAEVS